jgi:hypothetical protein
MNHEQMWDHLKAVSRPALIVGPRTYLDEMRTNVAADGIPEVLAPGAHAVLLLDRAGWHVSRDLTGWD